MSANVQFILDADEAKAVSGFMKLVEAQKKAERGAKQLGKASQDAGNKTASVFGSKAATDLRNFALGFIGVTSAIGAATKMLDDFNRVKEKAAEQQRFAKMGLGSLAQVSHSKEEYQQLINKSKVIFKAGGADNLDQAARIVFALKSAGALDDAELFTQMRAKALVEQPDVMARSVATLITTMGQQETGNARDVVSKALAASDFSPSSAESLLQAAAGAGTYGRSLRLSDEEVLAANAVTATATGSAEEGGTEVAALLKSLDQKGEFKGKQLLDTLQFINKKGMNDEQLYKYFGRAEAVQGYRNILNNQATFNEALAAERKAQTGDLVGQMLDYSESTSMTGAPIAYSKADNTKQMTETELFGAQRNVLNALRADMQTLQMEGGRGWFARYADQYAITTRNWLGESDARLINSLEPYASPYTEQQIQQLRRENRLGPAFGPTEGGMEHTSAVKDAAELRKQREALTRAADAIEKSANKLLEVAEKNARRPVNRNAHTEQ